jgi:Leucine-rich repeat (LRR) protein
MKGDIKLLVVFLAIFCSLNAFSQKQLNLDYYSYIVKQIEKKYNTKNYDVKDVINGKVNSKSIYKLIILNKKELSYFIEHVEDFINVEKLHIYKVKLEGFSFLTCLKSLRILSLAQNRKINYDSLVSALNRLPQIKHLYITNKRLCEFPNQINNLIHLKSLGIRATKIKDFAITSNLYYLDLSRNEKMNAASLEVSSSEVINLSDVEIFEFPKNLASQRLRALIFSQGTLMNFDCPIKGFDNLEILDIFSTRIKGVKNSCFDKAKKLEIIQKQEW